MCGETWSTTGGTGLHKLVSPGLAPLKVEIRTNSPVGVRLATRPQAPCAIAATRISCQHTLLTTTTGTSQRGPSDGSVPSHPGRQGAEPDGQLGLSKVQAQPKWCFGDLRNPETKGQRQSEGLGRRPATDNQNNGPQKKKKKKGEICKRTRLNYTKQCIIKQPNPFLKTEHLHTMRLQ